MQLKRGATPRPAAASSQPPITASTAATATTTASNQFLEIKGTAITLDIEPLLNGARSLNRSMIDASMRLGR